MMDYCPLIWPRAIVLMDLNAFFASIEQMDQPELRGRPVVVTNGQAGSAIITCSYEARAFGIKTGMRLFEARKRCQELVQCPSRPQRYAAISTSIMQALEQITPDIEIFSVDEAFLDVTACQRLQGTPARMGQLVKEVVYQASGLLCSVGVSGDKTTAKFAAKLQKPNGLMVIPPWEARARLAREPVSSLCGIADGIAAFLANYGVHYCGDMEKMPVSILAKRFGPLGRRIWAMCMGCDPAQVETLVDAPKSIGHGKVLPPHMSDKDTLLVYLRHMSEKVGARLRKHKLCAQRYFIGLRTHREWIKAKLRLLSADNDGKKIFQLCQSLVENQWCGQEVRQVQVTALDLAPANSRQGLLFDIDNGADSARMNPIMDQVNQRYGEFTLMPATLINRSSMPNVIAPAWKPTGVRETIS